MILSSPSKESLFLDIQNYRDIMDQEAPEDSGSSSAMGNGSLPLGVAPGKKNIPVKKSLYQYLKFILRKWET